MTFSFYFYYYYLFICFYFRIELNLLPIEGRRKAHKKPNNTLSGVVHAGGTFKKFMNYRSRGYRLKRITVRYSPAIRKVSFHRSGKTLNNIVHHYFICFRVG